MIVMILHGCHVCLGLSGVMFRVAQRPEETESHLLVLSQEPSPPCEESREENRPAQGERLIKCKQDDGLDNNADDDDDDETTTMMMMMIWWCWRWR